MARMHLVLDEHAIWDGADRATVRGTDSDQAEAESWTPPPAADDKKK